MNGRIFLRIVLALAVIATLAGLGVYVYNAGVAQGLAASGKLVAPESGVAPYPYYGRPFFFRPFGFGLAGCLFPLLFIFLVVVLLRGIFWRGPRAWGGHHGHWEKGVPPMFEEWHRKAHEPQAAKE
jgi:hypothetical protein